MNSCVSTVWSWRGRFQLVGFGEQSISPPYTPPSRPLSKSHRRCKRAESVVLGALRARFRALWAAFAITQGLGHGFVRDLQHPGDSAGRHSEAAQFSRLFSNLLIDERRPCIEKRESDMHLGEGSNWLRLRPPFRGPSPAGLRAPFLSSIRAPLIEWRVL